MKRKMIFYACFVLAFSILLTACGRSADGQQNTAAQSQTGSANADHSETVNTENKNTANMENMENTNTSNAIDSTGTAGTTDSGGSVSAQIETEQELQNQILPEPAGGTSAGAGTTADPGTGTQPPVTTGSTAGTGTQPEDTTGSTAGTGSETTTAGTAAQPSDPGQTADVSALDNTKVDWGNGPQTDKQNRPTSAIAAQKKYGSYGAQFIESDAGQTIYLTFDEGYENGYTAGILDTLKEKGVKAVFFVTLPYVKQNPDLVQRMIDEGHVVGNHSVTHPAAGMQSLSVEKQTQEVMQLDQYMQENFNYKMFLFRYPEGKFSTRSLAVVHNCGYTSVFWSFAYLDYDVKNQMSETKALEKIESHLHPAAFTCCTRYPERMRQFSGH